MGWRAVWFIVLGMVVSSGLKAEISKECGNDRECLIEVPGAVCADGTPSYITLTKRANAKHLLVYLKGGGACWSKSTCEKGYAKPLTRREDATEWTEGRGIHSKSDKNNPFGQDYNVITVPYCTGDVYAGNRTTNYGSDDRPYVIQHHGYENVKLSLAKAKELFPTPEKAALVGCSAGGIGAYYHLRNFAGAFPQAKKYVVSDAGTPFRPPYIYDERYRAIMTSWGAENTLPSDAKNFAEVMKHNTKNFGDVKFGFISSYGDTVMAFFALTAGSPSAFTAVKKSIIDASDNAIGRDSAHARVFYTESSRHCHTPESLGDIVSEGRSLGDWLHDMTEDYNQWDNVRPDLRRDVQASPIDEAISSVEQLPAY